MKLIDLKKIIDRYYHQHPDVYDDPEVVISIKLPYTTVGRQPTVAVLNVQLGFDWDSGMFILQPAEELTPGNRDFAKQMKEMQERAGWADHENRNLKAEIRRLKKKITEGSVGKHSDVVSNGGLDPQ
jgi:hypothetical protein